MYKIDRLLFHITSNSEIRRVTGIMLGRCGHITPNEPNFGMNEEEVACFWCLRSGIPWLGRADIGHDVNNKIVPFGSIAKTTQALTTQGYHPQIAPPSDGVTSRHDSPHNPLTKVVRIWSPHPCWPPSQPVRTDLIGNSQSIHSNPSRSRNEAYKESCDYRFSRLASPASSTAKRCHSPGTPLSAFAGRQPSLSYLSTRRSKASPLEASPRPVCFCTATR